MGPPTAARLCWILQMPSTALTGSPCSIPAEADSLPCQHGLRAAIIHSNLCSTWVMTPFLAAVECSKGTPWAMCLLLSSSSLSWSASGTRYLASLYLDDGTLVGSPKVCAQHAFSKSMCVCRLRNRYFTVPVSISIQFWKNKHFV